MIQTIILLSGNYLCKVLVTGISLNEIQSKAADLRMKRGPLNRRRFYFSCKVQRFRQ